MRHEYSTKEIIDKMLDLFENKGHRVKIDHATEWDATAITDTDLEEFFEHILL